MYIDDHVRAKRPLGYWKELLQEWVFLVHRIYRISGKRTAVYAEKERANTGLVAAAATRNGWVALEECRTTKVDKYLKEYSYSGRCDSSHSKPRLYEIPEKYPARYIVILAPQRAHAGGVKNTSYTRRA